MEDFFTEMSHFEREIPHDMETKLKRLFEEHEMEVAGPECEYDIRTAQTLVGLTRLPSRFSETELDRRVADHRAFGIFMGPKITKIAYVSVLFGATRLFAADAPIVAKVRAELASLLKKDPSSLAVDKPVQQLGADELHVVEWVMAIEEAYQIRLPDDKIVEKPSMTARKDLTIVVISDLAQAQINLKSKK